MSYLISVNPETCNGCKVCEITCSLYKEGECNPDKARIRVIRKEEAGIINAIPLVCYLWDDPPCLKACPVSAIKKDGALGVISIDADTCTGCGECSMACPIKAIWVLPDKNIAVACDLCGGDPRCVPLCHSNSLVYIEKDPGSETHKTGHILQYLKRENLL